MPSQVPTRETDYAVPAGGMDLAKDVWNAVFGDLSARLKALEAQRTDLQALIDAGTGQALLVIQENVAPQLAAVNAQVAALQTLIAIAEDRIAAISSGGIGAAQVVEDPTRVFVTPAQKAAIGTNATAIAANAAAVAAKPSIGLVIALG